MDTTPNEKGGRAATETQVKDSEYSTLRKVLEIFLSGAETTAIGLNQAACFNDSRKAIPVLRRRGYPTKDRRLIDRRKAYSMPHDWQDIMDEAKQINKQLLIFDL